MIYIMLQWLDIFDAAPVRKVAKGGSVFRQGDRVLSMYLVRSGTVALERPMTDGIALTLHIANADMALAEASLFADSHSRLLAGFVSLFEWSSTTGQATRYVAIL